MRTWKKRALRGKTALKRARRLIETPEHWTQGRQRREQYLPGQRDPVVSYCAVGALIEVSWPDTRARTQAFKALREAIPTTIYPEITYYNDQPNRTHAEILALFDRAIESL